MTGEPRDRREAVDARDARPAARRGPDRFADRARAAGLDVEVQRFPAGTRTAQDAAAALGCDVARIVKSLVFVAVEGDRERPVLVLTSGANRVDTVATATALGVERLRQAAADEVRAATGYAIGGTPPLGHDTTLDVVCDRDLLAFDQVWAAAGAPDAVFAVAPEELVAVSGALVADVAG